jgi:tetratricopeptide (TPR) repeat protein
LAYLLKVERSTIQRWEAGETRPQPWVRPKLARALGLSREQLTELLERSPQPELEASIAPRKATDNPPPETSAPTTATIFSALNPDELQHIQAALANTHRNLDDLVVTYFARQLAAHMADDGARGPAKTMPVVLDLLTVIEHSARDVRPQVRRQLLALGARGAEFAGWLYRDLRDLSRAGFWYDRATEWAQEAADLPMQGYILLKRSQMAYDNRDAVRVLLLAQAAEQGPWQLPPRVQAEATQQAARGLAMTGEPMGQIERKLDNARSVLATANDHDDGPDLQLGAYYNDGTLTLRTASCYIEAGQPQRAAILYADVLSADLLSHRDRGYFMARRTSALALAGEPDDAAAVGLASVHLATATDSARTKRELGRALQTLQPWISRPGPRTLREALAEA